MFVTLSIVLPGIKNKTKNETAIKATIRNNLENLEILIYEKGIIKRAVNNETNAPLEPVRKIDIKLRGMKISTDHLIVDDLISVNKYHASGMISATITP